MRPPWWGWGDPPPFPEALSALAGRPTPPVPIDQVRLPESRLPGALREHARVDREERVLHAAGKNYPDLVRLRSGDASGAPDGVLYPSSHEEVARFLAICAEEGVAVVPFGGGTSVVGGVEPLRGRFESVVALDLARIDHLTTDPTSLLGTFGAGLRGPRAEARLAGRGLTLGHFPQSFEFATIGGYAATRSAGQASTGYGRFDKLVLGSRWPHPRATWSCSRSRPPRLGRHCGS
jgi:alkyldihydroxyacetonephosphate synthase